MDAMRATLDALMGVNRDGDKESEMNRKFSDPDVCRAFLGGLCAHDLFTNTKIDMGACASIHNVSLREQYEEARQKGEANYDRELLENLDKLLVECDRKIARAMKRLEEDDPAARGYGSIATAIDTEDTRALTVEVKAKKAEIEKGGLVDPEETAEELRKLEDKRALLQAKALLASFDSDQEKKAAEDAEKPESEKEPE
eukprot:gene6604-7906_t